MINAVLDTNAILSSISRSSKYRHVIIDLLDGKFNIALTTDIILEYHEKVSDIFRIELADGFTNSLMLSKTTLKISPPFRHRLIHPDPDDNKFVDCYL